MVQYNQDKSSKQLEIKTKGLNYMKWFKDCKTIEDAKELYKKLCREYHPDLNESDTTETMKSINNEFEQVFKTLKNKHRAETTDSTADSRENETTAETPAEFMHIINGLIHCEGVQIDLVGRWVWLTGNTYPYKDIVKGLGFRYASKKKAWYWHSAEDSCKSRKCLSLDEIKNKYGCKSFATATMPKLATI